MRDKWGSGVHYELFRVNTRVNIRATRNSTSAILGVLEEGEEILASPHQVYGTNAMWQKVKNNDYWHGYVMAKYLDPLQGPKPQQEICEKILETLGLDD